MEASSSGDQVVRDQINAALSRGRCSLIEERVEEVSRLSSTTAARTASDWRSQVGEFQVPGRHRKERLLDKSSRVPTLGAELRACRRTAGLTQTALAALAGCQRGAVAYWERKDVLDRGSALVRRLARLVGMYDFETSIRTGARACAGWGLTPDAAPLALPEHATWSAKLAALEARIMARETRHHEKDLRRQATWEARQQVRQRAEQLVQRRAEREAERALRELARCGALTRKGQPCRMLSEPGRRRCKFHGGKSTGPRTPEGLARTAEAQRKRWSAWRAAHQGDSLISE